MGSKLLAINEISDIPDERQAPAETARPRHAPTNRLEAYFADATPPQADDAALELRKRACPSGE